MNASRRWFVAAVLVVIALAVVGTLVRPSAHASRATRGTVAPVTATTVVCPSVTGGPGGLVTDMTVAQVTRGATARVTYSPLGTTATTEAASPLTLRPAAGVRKTTPYGAIAVTASGPGADGVVASQTGLTPDGLGRGLSDSACLAPAGDWWFAGADGRIGITELMVLTNPSDALANVALSLWSANGPLNPPNTSGINIAPHTSAVLRISNFAPDAAVVAIHVHANSGTVTAAIVDRHTSGVRPVGVDWMPPTLPPANNAVVTGFSSGAALNLLYLVNPGDRDATVSLRVVTPTKNFQPAGHQSVVVPAGHTQAVDLSGAIAGESAAVVTTSDAPVAAEAVTLERPLHGFSEIAWVPAQPRLPGPAGLAANTPPFGQRVTLLLTAPAGTARVRVTTPSGASTVVNAPGGRTSEVDLRALLHAGPSGPGPLLLTPLGDQPVYAVRTLYASGAHGPLIASEVPTVLPRATALPAVVPDLRAATP